MTAPTSLTNPSSTADLATKALPNEKLLGSTRGKIILRTEDPEVVALLLADLARKDGKPLYKRSRKDMDSETV